MRERGDLDRRQVIRGLSSAGVLLGATAAGLPHSVAAADTQRSVFDVLKVSGHAGGFINALVSSGLRTELETLGEFTLFVPMGKLMQVGQPRSRGDRPSLTANPGPALVPSTDWRQFLAAHVVRGIHGAKSLQGRKVVFRTLGGTMLVLDATRPETRLNDTVTIRLTEPSDYGVRCAFHWLPSVLAMPPTDDRFACCSIASSSS